MQQSKRIFSSHAQNALDLGKLQKTQNFGFDQVMREMRLT